MRGVVDRSRLILFEAIGRLDLLTSIFNDVLVPDAVWHEVVTQGRDRSPGLLSGLPTGMRRIEAQPAHAALARFGKLGPGEVEVITAGMAEPGNRILVMDDFQARRIAERINLTVMGSLGVLLAAKRIGVTPSIAPLVSALRRAGLFADDNFVATTLRTALEWPPYRPALSARPTQPGLRYWERHDCFVGRTI